MDTKSQAITVNVQPAIDGIPSLFDVSFKTAIEMIHIIGMSMWEATAPQPGKIGLRGGSEMENSQQARLQFLLKGIGVLNTEKIYNTLAAKTRKHNVPDSKVTRNSPAQGLPLRGGWHLDCCLNLNQKLEIVESLRHLGYSRDFVDIAVRFVAGQPIAQSDRPHGVGGYPH